MFSDNFKLMAYFSLILSIFIFLMVVRLMYIQKRFDILNGVTVALALVIVFLDVDTIVNERDYPIVTFLNIAVIILWIINLRRKPLEPKDKKKTE